MIVKGFDLTSATENLIVESIKANHFPHAVLIEGSGAAQRAALADKIALALICGNKETVPCGECSDCIKASHRSHPDIIYREPDSGTSAPLYKVESIRKIVEDCYVLPNEADVKIYIIADADKMNISAQNAFLKTLEEPSAHSMYILLCSAKEAFLPTILSRVTLFNIGEEEREEASEEAKNAADAVALALTQANEYEILKAAGVFDKNQKLLTETLPLLEEIFAQALRIKLDAAVDEPTGTPVTLARTLSSAALLRLIDSAEKIAAGIKQNANLNLTIVRLCTCFRSAVKEQE